MLVERKLLPVAKAPIPVISLEELEEHRRDPRVAARLARVQQIVDRRAEERKNHASGPTPDAGV